MVTVMTRKKDDGNDDDDKDDVNEDCDDDVIRRVKIEPIRCGRKYTRVESLCHAPFCPPTRGLTKGQPWAWGSGALKGREEERK